jgi:hypothetical protein
MHAPSHASEAFSQLHEQCRLFEYTGYPNPDTDSPESGIFMLAHSATPFKMEVGPFH